MSLIGNIDSNDGINHEQGETQPVLKFLGGIDNQMDEEECPKEEGNNFGEEIEMQEEQTDLVDPEDEAQLLLERCKEQKKNYEIKKNKEGSNSADSNEGGTRGKGKHVEYVGIENTDFVLELTQGLDLDKLKDYLGGIVPGRAQGKGRPQIAQKLKRILDYLRSKSIQRRSRPRSTDLKAISLEGALLGVGSFIENRKFDKEVKKTVFISKDNGDSKKNYIKNKSTFNSLLTKCKNNKKKITLMMYCWKTGRKESELKIRIAAISYRKKCLQPNSSCLGKREESPSTLIDSTSDYDFSRQFLDLENLEKDNLPDMGEEFSQSQFFSIFD